MYLQKCGYLHNKRPPKEMGADGIHKYLTHLAVEQTVAASTQNTTLSALLFLYRHALQIECPVLRSPLDI